MNGRDVTPVATALRLAFGSGDMFPQLNGRDVTPVATALLLAFGSGICHLGGWNREQG